MILFVSFSVFSLGHALPLLGLGSGLPPGSVLPHGFEHLLVFVAADMQQAQLLMLAGFVMLGWVLARRQIAFRKRVNRDVKSAKQELKRVREHKAPSVPLSDAPVETQRWQVAMFDLQRELKAELDTRIAVVQTLLRQVDQRIEHLASLESASSFGSATSGPPQSTAASETATVTGSSKQRVSASSGEIARLSRQGQTAAEIADTTGLPLGEVELVISSLPTIN